MGAQTRHTFMSVFCFTCLHFAILVQIRSCLSKVDKYTLNPSIFIKSGFESMYQRATATQKAKGKLPRLNSAFPKLQTEWFIFFCSFILRPYAKYLPYTLSSLFQKLLPALNKRRDWSGEWARNKPRSYNKRSCDLSFLSLDKKTYRSHTKDAITS